MTMRAIIIEIQEGSLLVFDTCMPQQVVVHTSNASNFCLGDHVLIHYSGAMTMSIPPQISAMRITRIPPYRNTNRCF